MSFVTLPRSTRTSPAALRIAEAERRFAERMTEAMAPPPKPAWMLEAERERQSRLAEARERAAKEVRAMLGVSQETTRPLKPKRTPRQISDAAIRMIVGTVSIALYRKGAVARAEVAVDSVIDAVAQHIGVPVVAITGDCKTAKPVQARFAVALLGRELCSASYPTIGKCLQRHHTSVIHEERKARELLRSDPEFAATVADVRRDLLLASSEPCFRPAIMEDAA